MGFDFLLSLDTTSFGLRCEESAAYVEGAMVAEETDLLLLLAHDVLDGLVGHALRGVLSLGEFVVAVHVRVDGLGRRLALPLGLRLCHGGDAGRLCADLPWYRDVSPSRS